MGLGVGVVPVVVVLLMDWATGMGGAFVGGAAADGAGVGGGEEEGEDQRVT